MLKTTRWATLAALLMVAAAAAVTPLVSQAQGQPAPAATPGAGDRRPRLRHLPRRPPRWRRPAE